MTDVRRPPSTRELDDRERLAQLALSEADFQALIVDAAHLYGWDVFHVLNARGMTPGWPDLTMLRPPEALFVELKTERGIVTEPQERVLADLRACGFEVHLWRPSDEKAAIGQLQRRSAEQ